MERQAAALLKQGRHGEAEALYKQLLATGGASATALVSYAVLCGRAEKFEAMVPLLRRALALQPDLPEAHLNLGVALRRQGDLEGAIGAYRRALQLRPHNPDAFHNLGLALQAQGNLEAAVVAFRRTLQLRPESPATLSQLAEVLRSQGELAGMVACWRAAVAQNPGDCGAMGNLGLALVETEKAEEGVHWLVKSVQANGKDLRLRFNLAYGLQMAGRLEAAAVVYEQIVGSDPQFCDAWQNLTIVQRRLRRFPEALAAVQKLLAQDPCRVAALKDAAIILHELGDEAGATEMLRRAATQEPSELAIRYPAVKVEAICLKQQEITATRVRFLKHVLDLAADPSLSLRSGLPFNPSFWLSYHNADDKPLLEAVHALFTSNGRKAKPCTPAPQAERDRVGLISGCYSQNRSTPHVIELLYEPLRKALDACQDLESVLINTDHQERLEEHIIQTASSCSLLFFLDVDMSPTIWSLAHLRLAPVQVTSWGTPNTSGMASMDYYISAATIEPDDADMLYTETLIRLSRLPCIYSPPSLEGIRPDRKGFNLSSNEVLIGIPQSLFKFHPDYDAVLEQIVEAVPDARLVMLEGSRPHHTDRLRQRWGEYTPLLLERTVFLPRLDRSRYLILLDSVDILLDPFYFGSGNSFYEAMAIGTPLVTMPGRFMRGRIVAAGYKQMGLEREAPIATTAKEYVAWVKRLAADSQLRLALKTKIRDAASQHLFNDQSVASEFVSFFRAAIMANRAGQRLPAGWQPQSVTSDPSPSTH